MSSSIITKKALAISLKKLMKTVPLNKITVKDLVNDCNLNRQTFYYHFQDIYDLVEWIYKTEVIDGIANYNSYNIWDEGLFNLFIYIKGNKEFCYNTLNYITGTHIDIYFFSAIKDLVIGIVEEIAKDVDTKIIDKKFMAEFYSYAIVGIIKHWMQGGMQENPKLIIKKIKYLLEGTLVKYLDEYKTLDC